MEHTSPSSSLGTQRRPRLRRILLWMVIIVVIVLLLIPILVQLPVVQQYGISRLEKAVKENTGADLTLDRFYLNPWKDLTLEDVSLISAEADTILDLESLNVTFDKSLLSLMRRELALSSIDIRGGFFFLEKPLGADLSNIDRIIQKMNRQHGKDSNNAGDSTKTKAPAWIYSLSDVGIHDVLFIHDNQWKGNYEKFYVKAADIDVGKIDIAGKEVIIDKVSITDPLVDLLQVPVETEDDEDAVIQDPITFLVKSFQLTGGTVSLDNKRAPPDRPTYPGKLNLSKFSLTDIVLDLKDVSIRDWHFAGEADEISLQFDTGYKLQLSAGMSTITPTRTDINDVVISSRNTVLQDTIIMKYREYPDFKDFENQVIMDFRLHQSKILIDDLTHFIPALASKPLFKANAKQTLYYDGRLLGRVNNLRGRNVTMRLGELLAFNGNFSTRNLTIPGEELFNFDFKEFRTSSESIQKLSPGVNIPSNFANLGEVKFQGYFDGLIEDFVMSGNGRSDLGSFKIDMRLDTKGGKTKANYTGDLQLYDFDLGRWAEDPDFGKTTLRATVENGKGLTLESVNSLLETDITYLDYRGYRYENVEAQGEFENKRFNGKLELRSEDADFSFDGEVDFRGTKPRIDFQADVKQLDLEALNFMEDDFAVSGILDIDLIDSEIDSAIGTVSATDLKIDDGKFIHELQELQLRLAFDGKDRVVVARTDLGDVKINGDFRLTQIAEDIKYLIRSQYPRYADMLDLKLKPDYRSTAYFNYSIEMEDSRDLLNLLGAANVRFYNLESDGVLDNRRPGSNTNIAFDSLMLKRTLISDVQVSQTGDRGANIIGAYVGGIRVGKTQISPLDVEADINPENILFSIQSQRIKELTPMLDILGELKVDQDSYVFHFDRLFDRRESWVLNPDNLLSITDGVVDISDFSVSKDDQALIIRKSKDSDGLEGEVTGIDLGLLNEIWDYPKLAFAGKAEINFEIDKLSNINEVSAQVYSDDFIINDDNHGVLDGNVSYYKLDRSLAMDVRLGKDNSYLSSRGIVSLSRITSEETNHYDLNIAAVDYPLDILEYFIGDGISDTRGAINMEMNISDIDGKPLPSGFMTVSDGYVVVNYLQAGFFIDDQSVAIKENFFDATGAILTDINGQPGTITGGIRHDYFKDLRLDVSVDADDVVALNTQKGDNKLYYGYARGSLNANFTGPFSATDIVINATAGRGTSLIMPIQASTDYDDESSFVRFITAEDTVQADELELVETVDASTGVSVSMNLGITDQADLQIIFNERTGDILQGRGRGNLAIEVGREGRFEVYGNYEVVQGQYLFTKGWINKRFSVVKGGKIQWTGDPLNANINIDAVYEGLSTSLSAFLTEYLPVASENAQQQARNRTEVDLTLQMRGSLLQPDISFDLAFPNLTGELRSLADSKIRVLKSDQDALNQQVGSLIAFRSFLPTSNGAGGNFGGIAASSSFNTVSEFLSNQLSLMVSGLLAEAVDDVDFISSLDFRFDVSNYQAIDQLANESILESSEILLKLKPSFLNDRLVFDAGANIINNSPISSGTFVGEDVVIEYLLSQDGRLKLRAFQKSEETIEGRIRRFGVGLSYRKEFDNLRDFFTSVKKNSKKKEAATETGTSADLR